MVTYHAATEMDYTSEPAIEEPPQDLTFYVRNVNDTYGTNDRAGVELFAVADDGREWPVVTVIPGKRIRVHANAGMLGLQDEGEYPGIKQV